MFAEDMALCWSLARAAWRVAAVDDAVVTHSKGSVAQRAPRRDACRPPRERAALRVADRAAPARRLLFPLAAAVIGVRLAASLVAGRRCPT